MLKSVMEKLDNMQEEMSFLYRNPRKESKENPRIRSTVTEMTLTLDELN